MIQEATSDNECSEATQIYDTQDPEASALFVTQLKRKLQTGDRLHHLSRYKQFSKPGTDGPNLHVLLSASEGLKAANFKGVSSKPVRKGKQHLKFPLYLDHHIGIKEGPEISRFNLINQTADEDYDTDGEILRRTVNTCHRDCLATLR